MALLIDASALVALYNAEDRARDAFAALMQLEQEGRHVTAFAVFEACYLLRTRVSRAAEMALLTDLRDGIFDLESLTQQDLARCCELLEAYADLRLDLADASIVATAERLGIQRIATLDWRDFRVIRPLTGRPFTLIPWDEQPQ